MSKIDALGQLASLENQTSAIQTINENSDKIEEAFENTLSRDGSGPNSMLAPLDMNSQRVLNLPSPSSDNEPARWVDLKNALVLEGEIVLPALEGNAGRFLVVDTAETGVQWQDAVDISGVGDMKGANNLSELTNVPQARTTLGLGTAATQNVGTSGAQLIRANGDNTLSGNNSLTGQNSFTGSNEISGTGDLVLNNASASLSARSAGYRGAPTVVRNTNHTFTSGDSGLGTVHTDTAGHTYTIPPAFVPEGHFITIVNAGSGAVTINRGSGVALRKLGAGDNANISISQWGMATLYQYSLNNWLLLSAVNVT